MINIINKTTPSTMEFKELYNRYREDKALAQLNSSIKTLIELARPEVCIFNNSIGKTVKIDMSNKEAINTLNLYKFSYIKRNHPEMYELMQDIENHPQAYSYIGINTWDDIDIYCKEINS